MLRFKLHEIRLGRRTHLLLPKLNESQLVWLAGRLTDDGFKVKGMSIMIARKKGTTVHLNSSGHCWSSTDPGDLVVPLIPELLRFHKQRVPLADLTGRYFKVRRSARDGVARLTLRMETAADWKALRSSGQCALSPDEKAVASMLIESARGGCTLLTDFPIRPGGVRVLGNRQFYESFLEPDDAVAALREVGRSGPRNAYLPDDGLLKLRSFAPPSSGSLRALAGELGEWCFFRPA